MQVPYTIIKLFKPFSIKDVSVSTKQSEKRCHSNAGVCGCSGWLIPKTPKFLIESDIFCRRHLKNIKNCPNHLLPSPARQMNCALGIYFSTLP